MKNSLVFFFVLSSLYCFGQAIQQKLPERTRILFLLDGSGSMLAGWGETDRITAAKTLLSDLVDSLKVNPNLELALRAYGHRFSRGAQNCTDTKLEVGFSKNNHQLITNKLNQISPRGTTPIAYSLQQTANDFPVTEGYRNIVIIITDGIESCDGDPCAVSLALQRKQIFLKPFIIGIGMDLKYKQQFDCIGKFFDARDIYSFKKALSTAVNTSLEETSVSIKLLDSNNRPTETNVNVTFENNFTKAPVFDFIHYLDKNKQTDSVFIDPVLSYNIVVNTLPPAVKRNVSFTPGRHNVVEIPAARGSLMIKQTGSSAYPNGVVGMIKTKRQSVNNQAINTAQKYLVGTYDVEVLTLPPRIFTDVAITQSTQTTLTLPDPGIVNIFNNAGGYGSIYELNSNGTQTWVCELTHDQARLNITLQPGNYKVVFRVASAPGSKYTSIKTFTVPSGRSVSLRLFE